jgi:hypothetical protein
MLQKFFLAFIPIFVAIDPIGLVAIFTGLAANASPEQRRRQAFLGIVTALCVAIGFIFLGEIIFDALGITDADFQVAGGLILLGLAGRELLSLGAVTVTPAMEFESAGDADRWPGVASNLILVDTVGWCSRWHPFWSIRPGAVAFWNADWFTRWMMGDKVARCFEDGRLFSPRLLSASFARLEQPG